MTDGKSPVQVAELDTLLADPVDRQAMIDRQNQKAQEELMRRMGMTRPPTRPRPVQEPGPKKGGVG